MKAGVERIIVAVDYSSTSQSALRQGVRLAEHTGAGLVPVHVIEEEVFSSLGDLSAETRNRVLEEASRKLEAWVSDAGAGKYARAGQVLIGHPVTSLSQLALETPDTLVVMGYCGLNHHQERLGTLTSQCVRRLPVDLLVVRPGYEKGFRKITVGTDFSESADYALKQAFAIADLDGAVLNCIHVRAWLTRSDDGPHPIGSGGIPPVLESELVDADRKRLEELTEPLRDGHPAVDCRIFAESHASVAHALVSFLVSTETDLAVISTHGKGGLKAFLIGTTAERLLRDAPCSVWVAKTPDQMDALAR